MAANTSHFISKQDVWLNFAGAATEVKQNTFTRKRMLADLTPFPVFVRVLLLQDLTVRCYPLRCFTSCSNRPHEMDELEAQMMGRSSLRKLVQSDFGSHAASRAAAAAAPEVETAASSAG